jgi:hypothetical protein
MKRFAINLAALAAIAMGSSYLVRDAAANIPPAGCCYGSCMDYCTKGGGTFNSCHNTCNGDCSAC